MNAAGVQGNNRLIDLYSADWAPLQFPVYRWDDILTDAQEGDQRSGDEQVAKAASRHTVAENQ